MNDIDILRDTPPSLQDDTSIRALAEGITRQLLKVDAAIKAIELWDDLSTVSDSLLKHLAWQFHVDDWSDSASRAQRENLVKKAIDWHRHKGTVGMVEDAVSTFYQDAALQENWEYGGEPYHFRIVLYGNQMDTKQRLKLLTQIKNLKNTRSWLDGLFYEQKPDAAQMYVGAAIVAGGGLTRISASTEVSFDIPASALTVGASVLSGGITRI